MKIASTILLIASGAAVLAAIWTPIGSWWQWAITAIVLLLAGAGVGAAADTARQIEQSGGFPSEPRSYSAGDASNEFNKRRTQQEALHGKGLSPEEVTERIDQKRRQQETLNRPTYGKPSSKENDQR